MKILDFVMALICAFFIMSCNDGGNDSGDENTSSVDAVGQWSGTDNTGNTITMTFRSDGTFTGHGDYTRSGTYVVDGTQIIGSTSGYSFEGTFSGNSMTLQDSAGNTVRLTKQS